MLAWIREGMREFSQAITQAQMQVLYMMLVEFYNHKLTMQTFGRAEGRNPIGEEFIELKGLEWQRESLSGEGVRMIMKQALEGVDELARAVNWE
jgi:hypothetical protein